MTTYNFVESHNDKELISVIIPVYNVEKYLEKCIESVINQTYLNLEIILVNDGSTDSSGDICDLFATRDNRIVVIHNNNGGLSSARNSGLDIFKGKYVVFIDSDDYVDKLYIEYLYDLIKKNDFDIAICGYDCVTEYGDILSERVNEENIQYFNKIQGLEELFYMQKYSNSACMKLYNACLFDDIRYPIGEIYEDIPVAYELFKKANDIIVGNRQLYHYLYREGSISKRKFHSKRMNGLYFVEEIYADVVNNYPMLLKAIETRMFGAAIAIINLIDVKDESYKEYLNYTWKIVKKHRFTILKNFKSSSKDKIYALSSFFGINTLKKILLVKRKKR